MRFPIRPVMMLAMLSICLTVASQAANISNEPKAFRDLVYSRAGGKDLLMDLYLPQNVKGRTPVILWIHGGGWLGGDKQDTLPIAMGFIARGYAVATLNYRLSNEAVFPAQAIDCKSAVRWLRANATKYNLDRDHIAAWGHSAGGHLAAFLGVTNDVKSFDVGDNLDQSSSVQVVGWYAGVGDLVRLALTPKFEMWRAADSGGSRLIGGPVLKNREMADKASPIKYVSRKSAPFILYHGDKDDLVSVNQAISMYIELRKAGVDADLHILKGCGHAGEPFMSHETASQIGAFFDKSMKKAQ